MQDDNEDCQTVIFVFPPKYSKTVQETLTWSFSQLNSELFISILNKQTKKFGSEYG